MHFDDILVFLTVADLKSFSGAAKKLHRTQPAISKNIQRIESTFGLELFDRSQYRPSLTPAGKKLYHEASYVYEKIGNLSVLAEQLKSGYELTLPIAVDQLLNYTQYLEHFKPIKDAFPNCQIQLLGETMSGPIERLQSGKVALAFGENLGEPHTIEAIHLEDIQLIPVASPGFIEQYNQALYSAEQLSQAPQIILHDTGTSDKAYNFGVIHRAQSWSVTHMTDKMACIESGLGWGRMPLSWVQDSLKKGTLVKINSELIDEKTMALSMMRLKEVDHGPVATRLWNVFKDYNR